MKSKPNNSLIFRKARTSDKADVLALYESVKGTEFCVWNEAYPGEVDVDLDLAAGNLFVAAENGRVIGAISIVAENEMDSLDCWRFREAPMEFARVAVLPDCQGRGIGAFLVREIESELRGRGCRSVHILEAVCNRPALGLYGTAGYMFRDQTEMYGNTYFAAEKQI